MPSTETQLFGYRMTPEANARLLYN